MANSTSQRPLAAQPIPSKLFRYIFIVLLVLIILVCLAVLITWLVIKPRRIVYTVEKASIKHYNLTKNSLNATFEFSIAASNPSSKISIYYDSIKASVKNMKYLETSKTTIASEVVGPFVQPHRNVTTLDLKLLAQNMPLSGSDYEDIAHPRTSGEIEIKVSLDARVRFKVAMLKSRKRTLHIRCYPLIVSFSRPNKFDPRNCTSERWALLWILLLCLFLDCFVKWFSMIAMKSCLKYSICFFILDVWVWKLLQICIKRFRM